MCCFAFNLEALEVLDGKGKPLGSGWAIQILDKLTIEMSEVKMLRVSHFTEGLEQNYMQMWVNSYSD